MVWNMFFNSVGNVIIPTDVRIFFRGVGIPPTRYSWLLLGGFQSIGVPQVMSLDSLDHDLGIPPSRKWYHHHPSPISNYINYIPTNHQPIHLSTILNVIPSQWLQARRRHQTTPGCGDELGGAAAGESPLGVAGGVFFPGSVMWLF